MTSISGPEFRFVPSTSLNLFQDSTFGSISTRSSLQDVFAAVASAALVKLQSLPESFKAAHCWKEFQRKPCLLMPLIWQVSETIRNLGIIKKGWLPSFVFFGWLLEGTRDVQYGLGLCDAWGIHFNRGPTNQLSSWHHSRLVSNLTCDFLCKSH